MKSLITIPRAAAWVLATGLAFSPPLLAQTTRPALAQLDRELRSLHQQVEAGTVHVRLPVTPRRPMVLVPHPLDKWGSQLNEDMRHRLEELRRPPAPISPGTRPATQPARQGVIVVGPNNEPMRIVSAWRSRDDGIDEQLGLILDDQGHLVFPVYVSREAVGDRPLHVTVGLDPAPVPVRFIGSDAQAGLTVLKMDHPTGRPLPVSERRLEMGEMVLMLQPRGDWSRLNVWTGGADDDDSGLIIRMDGSAAGLVHDGHVMPASAVGPIVRQLIEFGRVRRAKLGVLVVEVLPNDPLRQRIPALAGRPALRIARVLPNTAASQAGLKDGDLILALAGESVGDTPAFAAAIANRAGPVEITVLRDGNERSVKVDLKPE